jgi:hypothetical protein
MCIHTVRAITGKFAFGRFFIVLLVPKTLPFNFYARSKNSARLSVHIGQIGCHWTDFDKI